MMANDNDKRSEWLRQAVRELLAERGMTYRDAEEQTGLSSTAIWSMGQGKKPKVETLLQFTKGMGVDSEAWLRGVGYAPPRQDPATPVDALVEAARTLAAKIRQRAPELEVVIHPPRPATAIAQRIPDPETVETALAEALGDFERDYAKCVEAGTRLDRWEIWVDMSARPPNLIGSRPIRLASRETEVSEDPGVLAQKVDELTRRFDALYKAVVPDDYHSRRLGLYNEMRARLEADGYSVVPNLPYSHGGTSDETVEDAEVEIAELERVFRKRFKPDQPPRRPD